MDDMIFVALFAGMWGIVACYFITEPGIGYRLEHTITEGSEG